MEPRHLATQVRRCEVVGAGDGAGEEATAQRAVRHDADAQFARGGQNLILDVARPQRPLGLHRHDRVGGVRPAQRAGARLAQSEVANLSLGDQLGHGADRLLDRHAPVQPVLVVEVDVIDAEPPQRRLAGMANVLGPAVDGEAAVPVTGGEPELGGDDDLVATALHRPPDQFLVGVGAVDVGGVE